MASLFHLRPWCGLLAASLQLTGRPATAQLLAPPVATARAYDFLTLTLVGSTTRNTAKLLLAPAFNGRTEIQLEPVGAFLPTARLEQLRHNDELLTQSLGELSAAGWELIQVAPAAMPGDKDLLLTRYLLRRARP